MSKDKKHHSRKEESHRKYSKLLTPEQKDKFKSFGEPKMDQNWLELFTGTIMEDLRTIMGSCSDNQRKAEYVERELSDYGFYSVGLGTNILTMANPAYPGVVFKIALDDFGVADNFNDVELSKFVPRYNRVFARDSSAMVSVQERLVLPTPHQMEIFEPRIISMLRDLSKYFLVADLSPDNFLNYGVTRDGDFRFIDGSDLYPLSQLPKEPRCNRIVGEHKHTGKFKYCEGKLRYNEDYSRMICQSCGKEYIPLEFRPRKDVNRMYRALSDGLTAEERRELERAELGLAVQKKEEDDDKFNYLGDKELDEMVAGMREKSRSIFADPGEISRETDDDDDDSDEDEEVHVIRPKSRQDEYRTGKMMNANCLDDDSDDHPNDGMSGGRSDDQEEEELDSPTFIVDDDDEDDESEASEHPTHKPGEGCEDNDRDDDGFLVLRPRKAPLPTLTDPDPAENGEDEDRVGQTVDGEGDEAPLNDEAGCNAILAVDEVRPAYAEGSEEETPTTDIRMSDEYKALKERLLRAKDSDVMEGDDAKHDTDEGNPGVEIPVSTVPSNKSDDGNCSGFEEGSEPGSDTEQGELSEPTVDGTSALVQEDAGGPEMDPEIAQFQKLVAVLRGRQDISPGDKAVYRGLLKTVRDVKLKAVDEFVSNFKAHISDESKGNDMSEPEQELLDLVRASIAAAPKSDVSRSIKPEEVEALHGIIERQGHINDSLLRELNERGKQVLELERLVKELQSSEKDVNGPSEAAKDNQIADLTERLTGLTAELQTARDNADSYLGQLNALKESHEAEIGAVHADAEARLASLQTANEKLQQELDQANLNNKQVADVLKANAGFEMKIQQQHKEIDSLNKVIAQQKKLLSEAAKSAGDDDYDQLLQEKKAIEAEVEELRAQVADTGALDTMAKELEELRVKNELANKIISGDSGEDTRPDRAHYHVINENGSDTAPAGSSLYPGIYIDVYGDFAKAMAETGLNVFVGIGTKTYYKAIDYHDLLESLRDTHQELIEDTASDNRG